MSQTLDVRDYATLTLDDFRVTVQNYSGSFHIEISHKDQPWIDSGLISPLRFYFVPMNLDEPTTAKISEHFKKIILATIQSKIRLANDIVAAEVEWYELMDELFPEQKSDEESHIASD